MIERRRELFERHFRNLLIEGRREGLIRKDLPFPLIHEILLSTLQSILNPPKMAELGLTAILTVVLKGVMTPAGRWRV